MEESNTSMYRQKYYERFKDEFTSARQSMNADWTSSIRDQCEFANRNEWNLFKKEFRHDQFRLGREYMDKLKTETPGVARKVMVEKKNEWLMDLGINRRYNPHPDFRAKNRDDKANRQSAEFLNKYGDVLKSDAWRKSCGRFYFAGTSKSNK